ncbi:MAG TPA: HAMP domain-containing sensor histidine kinase [Acidimicrobiia bacterium]|nr:HAMP domain-containing sensor histidine kinase [Acidimicrobiia bacterium]
MDGNGYEVVDLDTVVIAATAPYTRSARVSIDASGIEPSACTGDPTELGRLVTDLVDNAVRFAASRVAVSVFPTPAGSRLTVVDDGPGIPEGEWEHVFEPGVRLDADPGHAGTGLSDAREIVGRHRATVRVEPSARGARLVVDLPA